ncbi:MAG: SDR family oxidoreductase [Simkaniaceae bacterium]|nr:SDR family oxidoreductase [Simkaniaceae bacterium]
MKGIILSITSDIATEMALQWDKAGWNILGSYHSKQKNYLKLTEKHIPLIHCDFSSSNSVETAALELASLGKRWDFLIFAAGTQSPIGAFEKISINEWIHAIHINFLNQIKLLHLLLPYRSPSSVEKSVLFFAGGGTNNTVDYYSSYTVSKIALIKMCELLDSEIKDVKFSIIGPGWVKTKIHQTTLYAGEESAGPNFEKTKEKLTSDECVPISKVIDSFEWVLSQPKEIVGGRNFSTVFDRLGTEELVHLLAQDTNMYKLRRSGNNILT